jgi:hypothetical protein
LIDSLAVRILRAALYRQPDMLEHGDQDLQGWRNRLLDGLCAVAFWLGVLVVIPSMWGGARQGHWPLVVTDVIALAGTGWLHYRRDLAYQTRARHPWYCLPDRGGAAVLAWPPVANLSAGCAGLVHGADRRCAAMLAPLCCSATLFLAGYVGNIEPGMAVVVVSPFAHWAILSVNFAGVDVADGVVHISAARP